MSRRTLRGAIPTTDSIVASTATTDSTVASTATTEGTAEGTAGSGASVFRPPPGAGPAAGEVGTRSGRTSVDPDNRLLRGVEAARARRIDLVTDAQPENLAAVGPWADQIDDAREAARSAGFQQGRQEGLAAGLEAAKTKVEQQRQALTTAIEAVVDQLNLRAEELGEQLAGQATDLAVEIARAVLDREVGVTEDPGAEAIARCLDLVPDTGCLVVRLHPDDAAGLGPVPGLGDRELVVAADPALAPGDAIVSVDQITIDARLSESLRRVEEALR